MNGFVVPKPYDQRGSLELLKVLRQDSLNEFKQNYQISTSKVKDSSKPRKQDRKHTKIEPIPETRTKHGQHHPNKPRVRHTQVRKRNVATQGTPELKLHLDALVGEDENFCDVDLDTDRGEKYNKKQGKESINILYRIRRFLLKFLCPFCNTAYDVIS